MAKRQGLKPTENKATLPVHPVSRSRRLLSTQLDFQPLTRLYGLSSFHQQSFHDLLRLTGEDTIPLNPLVTPYVAARGGYFPLNSVKGSHVHSAVSTCRHYPLTVTQGRILSAPPWSAALNSMKNGEDAVHSTRALVREIRGEQTQPEHWFVRNGEDTFHSTRALVHEKRGGYFPLDPSNVPSGRLRSTQPDAVAPTDCRWTWHSQGVPA